MKREVKRPTPPPASSCAVCFKPGFVSENQLHGGGTKPLADAVTRFECTSNHTWTTNTVDALAHGRFLQRLGDHS